MSRRTIALIAGSIALLVVMVLAVRALWPREQRSSLSVDRYVPRDLLLPDARFRLPSVEEQLLRPDTRLLVDPTRPLDRSIVDAERMNIVDAIDEELTPRVEQQIERLIFDD